MIEDALHVETDEIRFTLNVHMLVPQPPVPVHGIAGRYAAALYMAGARAKKLDVIDKDLSKVRTLVAIMHLANFAWTYVPSILCVSCMMCPSCSHANHPK